MKHFTFKELSDSQTAMELGIENLPNLREEENLRYLVETVLDQCRDHFDKPIVVTSGYRCKELNKIVGGVESSQHIYGEACDISLFPHTYQSNTLLFNYIKSMLFYDYCYLGIGRSFVHVSAIKPRINRCGSS